MLKNAMAFAAVFTIAAVPAPREKVFADEYEPTRVFAAHSEKESRIPDPADGYYSWVSPEVSDEIGFYLSCGISPLFLDYNGDGDLTVSDAVCVYRRYLDNVEFGNELTVDSETVSEIVAENYDSLPVSWYFDVEGLQSESVTVCDVTDAVLHLEFDDGSEADVLLQIDPFQEMAFVVS